MSGDDRVDLREAPGLAFWLIILTILVFLTLLIYLHYVNAFEYYSGLKKTLIASALSGLPPGRLSAVCDERVVG